MVEKHRKFPSEMHVRPRDGKRPQRPEKLRKRVSVTPGRNAVRGTGTSPSSWRRRFDQTSGFTDRTVRPTLVGGIVSPSRATFAAMRCRAKSHHQWDCRIVACAMRDAVDFRGQTDSSRHGGGVMSKTTRLVVLRLGLLALVSPVLGNGRAWAGFLAESDPLFTSQTLSAFVRANSSSNLEFDEVPTIPLSKGVFVINWHAEGFLDGNSLEFAVEHQLSFVMNNTGGPQHSEIHVDEAHMADFAADGTISVEFQDLNSTNWTIDAIQVTYDFQSPEPDALVMGMTAFGLFVALGRRVVSERARRRQSERWGAPARR